MGAELLLGGVRVDLCRPERVLDLVARRILDHRVGNTPLAIGSANLDHIHHFGTQRRSGHLDDGALAWMMLMDGAPLARRARRVTGVRWPRLAGSDMLEPILAESAALGARVGFLGGWEHTHVRLRQVLAERHPGLTVAGFWQPTRSQITDDVASHHLARSVAAADVDVLVVGLGKPRQELWIERHAHASGAKVLLGFGAAAEFLAGTAHRAPMWMRQAGLEWSYRLVHEPRRLARRYLLDGPRALNDLYTVPAAESDACPSVRSTRSDAPVPGPSPRW